MAVPVHPYPPETRVHYAAEPTPGAYEKGTATVLGAAPQADGSFTYRVRRDSGGEAEWVSYFTIPVGMEVPEPPAPPVPSYEPAVGAMSYAARGYV